MNGLQAGYRVEALVVGRGGLAERLGYVRSQVNGPWMLRVLFSRVERRAHIVPDGDVQSWDLSSGVLHLTRHPSNLA